MEEHEVTAAVALGPEALGECVRRIARDIVAAYPIGSRVMLVVVMDGALKFSDDLLCRLLGYTSARFERCRLKAGSHRGGKESTGTVEIEYDENLPVEGRDVLIVDDVYDTGRTLQKVKEHLRARGACEIKTCVLLEKDKQHEFEIDIDFLGTMVDDRFLVGYGLDLDGKYRDLPYVGYMDDAE